MANDKLDISKNSYVYGFLVGAILVGIFVGFLAIRPLWQDNAKQQQILDNRTKTASTLNDKKSKLEDLSSKSKDITAKADKVKISIPEVENKKQLTFALYTMAANSGLTLTSINDGASAVVSTSADTSATSSSPILTNAHEEYFNLSLKGSYTGLLTFLDYLKGSLRIVTVNNVGAQEEEGGLNITIDITAYTTGDITQNAQL